MMPRPLRSACVVLSLPLVFAGCATEPPPTRPGEVIGVEMDAPKPAAAPKRIAATSSATAPRKVWTVAQVEAWYPGYIKSEPADSRGLLYQGSDASFHYFTARVSATKTWNHIAIAKSELRLAEEKPDRTSENPPRGHGFIDPMNGFRMFPRGSKP